MAGHTKGPWVDNLHHERREGGRFYTHVTATGLVPIACVPTGVEGFGREEGRANAHLIAAAPELLGALLIARDYVADAASGGLTYKGSGEGFMAMAKEDLARIDAAIAKAKGETK